MGERIRGQVLESTKPHHAGGKTLLNLEPLAPGETHQQLWTYDPEHGEHAGVLLDAERCEHLGIALQIRASFLRGRQPPPGPEPDRTPGPDDVPLIPDTTGGTDGR